VKHRRCEVRALGGPLSCRTRLTSIVVMRQPSTLVSGVQFPGGDPGRVEADRLSETFGSNPKPSPSRDGCSGRRPHIRPDHAPLAQRQSTWLLPRGSGYRNSGGVLRAGTANWQSGQPQKPADVGSTPTSRTDAGWDDWPPSSTLNPAHAGSNPAPAAVPSHTACDLAPVRQETRVGTG
jgi:hypothetical protein